MKLKTAFQDEDFKLGEVADVSMATMPDGRIAARATAKVGGEHTFYYDSLEAFYNDWEDYEEPEEFWYINECGDVLKYKYDGGCSCPILEAKEIGNYFNTREEAEKAVEKLRAWKRLKDSGLKITGYGQYAYDTKSTHHIDIALDYATSNEDRKDLDLLFGGEE